MYNSKYQSSIKPVYSRHWLGNDKFIDVRSMMTTLNCLRLVSYEENYDITNTRCKTSYPLKDHVLNYYRTEEVCKHPIVVTDDDFCLDGRHRVAFHKQNNVLKLPAYIVPRSYVDKFIESL